MTRTQVVEGIARDLGYTIRGFRRTPGLGAAIVLTLGLGVGANVAMFTVLDRVLFQAPPGVVKPGMVRRVLNSDPSSRGMSRFSGGFGIPDLNDQRAAARDVADLEGYA